MLLAVCILDPLCPGPTPLGMGQQLDWDTMGQGHRHSGTGTHWDWNTMAIGTQQVWYTTGLEHSGAWRQ